jgi:phospholipid/cholesterol/gamma-HCH transport system substrate-binding protein
METRANYAAVGAFVLAMMVIAVVAVLWIARGALTTQLANYDIFFQGPVTGLRTGAQVEYNGVQAGKVTDVRIDPDNVELIRVTVEINADVAIKTDAVASVETNILSGVAYIEIVGGTKDAPLVRPLSGQRYAVINSHRSRLASVTLRGGELLEKLNETAERVNAVLDENNRRNLAETLGNLQTFSAGLASHNKDFDRLISTANDAARSLTSLLDNVDRSYSGPDGLGQHLNVAITDFDRVAKNLNDTNHQLQLALQDVRPGLHALSQQTVPDVGALVAETRQLVAGLNRVADEIGRNPSRVLFGDRREGYKPQ